MNLKLVYIIQGSENTGSELREGNKENVKKFKRCDAASEFEIYIEHAMWPSYKKTKTKKTIEIFSFIFVYLYH